MANVEHIILLKCSADLTREISAAPLLVSEKLLTKGLIPGSVHSSAQLQAKEEQLKASEIVSKVTNKVETFPSKFEVFLGILDEFLWLKDIVKLIRTKYDELKAQQLHDTDIKNRSCDVNVPVSENATDGVLATSKSHDTVLKGQVLSSLTKNLKSRIQYLAGVHSSREEHEKSKNSFIKDYVNDFIEKCLQHNVDRDDIKSTLSQIYSEVLISSDVYEWAIEFIDSGIPQNDSSPQLSDHDEEQSEEFPLFCEDTVS